MLFLYAFLVLPSACQQCNTTLPALLAVKESTRQAKLAQPSAVDLEFFVIIVALLFVFLRVTYLNDVDSLVGQIYDSAHGGRIILSLYKYRLGGQLGYILPISSILTITLTMNSCFVRSLIFTQSQNRIVGSSTNLTPYV